MPGFIFRKTSRELRDDLRASARGEPRILGRARTTEEAHDIERRLERETGREMPKPLLVSNEAPESHQARVELAQRSGLEYAMRDPERAVREGLF